jgi:hypothetical protein
MAVTKEGFMAIYALVVGINQYLGNVPNLGGCHYDAMRVMNVLQQRFQLESSQVRLLLSEAATRAAIIDGFQQHLAQAKAGDTALFYYSGHGSQEQMPSQWWAVEADRQNETLVCHDSRLGTGDLADKELRFLIAELAKKSIKVVIIMDCCHSGNGTRDAGLLESCIEDDAVVNIRLAKSFSQRRTINDYLFSDQAKREGWLNDISAMPEGEHILLSGCQDSELSKELTINGQRQGAFTHFLCKTLENTQLSLSYRNLLRKVKLQVRNLVDKQNPTYMTFQNANPDELFLGNSVQPLRLAVFIKEKQWWLDAGMIQGMQQGDEIAVYANIVDETATNEETNSALLTTQLIDIQAEKSRLVMPDNKKSLLDSETTYYAKILQRFVPKLAIAFDGDQEGIAVLKAECEKIANSNNTDLLNIVDIDHCDYRILAKNQAYGLLRADQDRFMFERVQTYQADSAAQILQQAQHLARWHNKLALSNQNSRIPDNTVELVVSYEGEEYIGDEVNMRYSQQYGEWVEPEFTISLRYNIDSDYQKPLFCSVLVFNPFDASVDVAMDNGVWLRPHTIFDNDAGSVNKIHAVTEYVLFDGEAVIAEVDDQRFLQGITQTRDIFKLIVSEIPFNANLLSQDGLETYNPNNDIALSGKSADLQSMLDESLLYAHTRKIRRKSKKQADWTCHSITINTERPRIAKVLSAKKVTRLVEGVQLEAHPLRAMVSLENSSALHGRSVAGHQKLTPDSLSLSEQSQAFTFSHGRGVDGGLDTLVIQTENTQELQDQVNPEQPLMLDIANTLADNENILPYVSDGNYFYPVGFSHVVDQRVKIVIEAVPAFEQAEQQENTQGKGIGKTLKVFFQKVTYDQLRLRKQSLYELAQLTLDDSGNISQRTALTEATEDIQKAQRILLLVHGIITDTQSLIPALQQEDSHGKSLYDHYDIILSFDYESLNTRVQDSSRILKEQLSKIGLGQGHGKQLDIIGLDLGGLLARWLIEKEDYDKNCVNQLILVGVPNQGTPWVSLKDKGLVLFKSWAYGSLTLILNNLTVVPVGGLAVSGMVKLLDAADNSFDQMHPESELLTELAQSKAPQCHYFVMAGNTEKLMVELNQAEKSSLARLLEYVMKRSKLAAYDFFSEKLFKQANDFAFSHHSMCALPTAFNVECNDALDCDHFSYFHDEQSVKQIRQALMS